MGKKFTLLVILLLTLGFTAGYLFLSKEIIAGSLKIAAGQQQLDQGKKMLAEGKARLSSGQQQLSQAKSRYKTTKTASYLWSMTLPVVGGAAVIASNKIISDKIAQGEQMVAKGKNKIKAGEQQLNAGNLELNRGIERLHLANKIRIACAIAAIFFISLFIVLLFYWRR